MKHCTKRTHTPKPTTNTQANRLRRLFLAAALRQDAAFYDAQATTGGLLQRLNDDAAAVQAGLSEKSGQFLQHGATFVAGFVLAFIKGWDVTLVLVGCLPVLAALGALVARFASAGSARAQAAYAEAGALAQQALAQVRTVAACGGEAAAAAKYDALLAGPQKVRVFFLSGCVFVVFCQRGRGVLAARACTSCAPAPSRSPAEP